MNAISWPVLGITQVTPKDFVRFWQKLYSGYDEKFYQEHIGQPLTEDLIEKWFEWKNGKSLSALKKKTIRRYLRPEERISHDANADTLAAFLNLKGGAIWRIFWLHLQHPLHFPIYDQHVHRAMAFMLKWPEPNFAIPAHNPTKVRNYLEDFRPFFEVFRPFYDRFDDYDRRQVDRALWSFGRFLKSKYGHTITSPPNDELPQPNLSPISLVGSRP
jgi:hypothetical protein